jgi:hypothetical protein
MVESDKQVDAGVDGARAFHGNGRRGREGVHDRGALDLPT